jgi:hypothetical protein
MSRKLLSALLDATRKGRPIEPKNLYDGHCHAVSRRGNNASAAIIFGWQVEIGGLSIPFWVSWLGVLVAGTLAYLGFTHYKIVASLSRRTARTCPWLGR